MNHHADLQPANRRLLVIDDNPAIHDDFRKILGPADDRLAHALEAAESRVFGEAPEPSREWSFQIDFAFQGREGLEKVRAAVAAGAPYAVAFEDVRIPPGWDGIETITHIWSEFPDLQIVICTAYSDYSWDEIARAVGSNDQVLVLKKPFDNVEVLQMAHALAKKWQLTQIAHRHMAELDALVHQRTAELRTANAQLVNEMAERAAAEDALRQAHKMEAVGRLAAGVAHDFNNMLTVILGYASILQTRQPPLDADSTTSLHRVEQAAERSTALTRQLLAYSRKQTLQRRPLALNELVEQTVGLLRRVIGENIAVELHLAPSLPQIFADASSIDQVIMNLALNARDAMPDGGQLTLTTTAFEIDAATRAQHPDAQPGAHVCLTVRDSGHGMDAATVSRIFDPFFTTKEPGKGTGMGMATVHGVVKQHHGWIDVESAPGRGTLFRVVFPVSAGKIDDPCESPQTAVSAAPSAINGHRTILVVEDEELVRQFVDEALSALGYRVLPAANGREALEIWATRRDDIDLLLTDMVMPESISGRQLARTLVGEKPALKVIFTSGYSAESMGPDSEQPNGHAFLAKPFLTDRLAQVVAQECGGWGK